jgi:intracellular septation protein
MPLFERGPNENGHAEVNPLLKLALELGPLAIFFFGNAYGDRLAVLVPPLAALGGKLFVATALFIVATFVALVASFALTRRLPIMPVVTGVVVLIFGGLTLWLRDDTFIKMKPTIVNSLFGSTLLIGLLFKQGLLRYVFGDVYKLKPEGWTILTLRWGLFFFVLAALNEIVWRTQTTDFWVAFKVWATMPLTLIFAAWQLPILTKYAFDPKKPVDVVPPMDPLP